MLDAAGDPPSSGAARETWLLTLAERLLQVRGGDLTRTLALLLDAYGRSPPLRKPGHWLLKVLWWGRYGPTDASLARAGATVKGLPVASADVGDMLRHISARRADPPDPTGSQALVRRRRELWSQVDATLKDQALKASKFKALGPGTVPEEEAER